MSNTYRHKINTKYRLGLIDKVPINIIEIINLKYNIMKQLFLAVISITDENHGVYKKGEQKIVPVFTNNESNVEKIIYNRFWGSEYPDYKIESISKFDDFLFKPILNGLK